MTATEPTVEAGRDLYRRRHGQPKPEPTIVPADTEPVLPGDIGAGDLADGRKLYDRRSGTP